MCGTPAAKPKIAHNGFFPVKTSVAGQDKTGRVHLSNRGRSTL
jgi:hypothetical protein